VIGIEHVKAKGFELADLFLDALNKSVDLVRGASHSLKVITKNGEEFLLHLASLLEVVQDELHVLGFVEDFLNAGEVPASNSGFLLDGVPSLLELLLPVVEHADALLDCSNRVGGAALEDRLDLDLLAHLGTDLV
jgi:hypothetical protein